MATYRKQIEPGRLKQIQLWGCFTSNYTKVVFLSQRAPCCFHFIWKYCDISNHTIRHTYVTKLLTQKYLSLHESVAYAYISSIKEGRRMGDGVFVREGRRGGLLSEAHNLIIQSIEQHIHFIVLEISLNSLDSSKAVRRERGCFMY